MWIGWASAVKLCSSQISVAPTAGFSVTGWSQSSGLRPRAPIVPSLQLDRPAEPGTPDHPLGQRQPPGVRRTSEWLEAGKGEPVGWVAPVGRPERHDAELHHLTGRPRVGERLRRLGQPTERLVRPEVDQVQLRPGSQTGEVHDRVHPFGRGHQHLVELDRCGQEAALGTDHPDRQGRLGRPGHRVGGDLQDEEPGVAAVEHPEAVPPRLDVEDRPGPAVDDHGVGEELRVPDRRHVVVRSVGPGEAVEEPARPRVEQRPVRVEGAVLDGERDLVVRRPRRVTETRGRSGEYAARQVARPVTEQVEPRRTGVHVEPGHAERVVVEPQGGRSLVVRVLEDGATRPPPVTERGPVPEEGVERAVPREAGGDVVCPGQVPRLGVAVAVVEGVAAVHVGDDRHRTAVRPRGASERGLRIPARRATRRVRPVQCRVHRKQVRPEVPVPVDQAVDPRHPHRAPVPRLDREGGGVERARVVHRPVAPDGGRR